MAITRTRERIVAETPRGTAKRLASTSGGNYNVVTTRHTCNDTIADGDGHPFSTLKYRMTGGVIQSYPEEQSRVFNQYLADYFVGNAELRNHLPTDAPSDGVVAAWLLNKTNPSRPEVDLPIFIGELKDIPGLIRIAGKNLMKKKQFLRRGASANLEYQFGWAPLISDLFKLFTFQGAVDSRVKELKALKEGGLSRTRIMGTYSNHFNEGRVFQSLFSIWSGPVQKITNERVTGHVKWWPIDNGFPKTDAAMLSLARRAALGWTLDASTAWELIPWSWLIDWCTNTGIYLGANRNIVPAWHTPVEVMRHQASIITSGRAVNVRGEMSPIYCEVESKSRRRAFPSLQAHLPFLNARQLSILGSIGILRSARRAQ